MKTETATLAGGCFWCTEAVFQRLKGVISTTPGYAGGNLPNPTYKQVCRGNTGHSESIQIEFDPDIISFEKILDVFWHTHDPTTQNRQGNDVGPQYRSVIFYHNSAQKAAAEQSREKLVSEEAFKNTIVTEILPFTNFYKAEDYHENYFEKNKNKPYCTFVINPKIIKLLEKYGKDIKEEYNQNASAF